ncbi:MAG: protoporphyrinogen oxidase [Gemmatimonadales bacterium]
MSARRVAVIGGGLAGLAAGAALRGLGAEPCVFERDAAVGGVVRSEMCDGWLIESGPCMAAEPDPVVRALMDAAGVAPLLVRADPVATNRYIVHDGVPAPLPHNLAEFTASPLLSLAGRLRLVKERFIPARRELSEESVDDFARRRFGDEVADRMFDPLVACTSAGDPRQLLARYACPQIVGHEQRSGSGLQGNLRARMDARRRATGQPTGPWSCATGMQQLARQLAERSAVVRTGARVDAVSAHGGKIQVVVDGQHVGPFDGAIFAVPAPGLQRMAIDLPEAHRLEQLASMPHVSIATVSLGFRRDAVRHRLDASRLLVPSVERQSILSAVFPSSIFSGRAPHDHVLLTAYLGGTRRPDVIDWPEADLIGLVHQELTLLLGVSGPPVMVRVTVRRDALPQAVAGHARRVAAADIVEAAAGPVTFTGAWRDGLSVAEVLLGGVRAAERLAVRQGWLGVPTPA